MSPAWRIGEMASHLALPPALCRRGREGGYDMFQIDTESVPAI